MSALPAASGASTSPPPQPERLGRILQGQELGGFRRISDAAGCLMPLLNALGWRGEERHLAEALPHFADSLDIDSLRGVLANLNYATRPLAIALRKLDPRLLPCLYLVRGGPTLVVLGSDGDTFTVFNGRSATVDRIDGRGIQGTAYLVNPAAQDADDGKRPQNEAWFAPVARRFRGLLLQMLGITLATSVLALVVPLFIMAIYDMVIPARSPAVLGYLLAGAALALGVELLLRLLRARLLAYLGARIDMVLGTAAFQQILHLPLTMTERATIGAQLTRLKQFEAVREFFTGTLAGVFLELPFALLFIGVVAILGGPLAWIPAVLIAAFAVAGALLMPIMRRSVFESGEARTKRQTFLIEMLSNLRTIKTGAGESIWSERFRTVSARTAMSNFHTTQISVLTQTVAQTLMLGAGIATLGFGSLLVLDQRMSVGALVACMALIWRVLAPLQLAFLSLSRLEQVRLGLRQINHLMQMKRERDPGRRVEQHRSLRGEINFARVSLRYSPNSEPALLGFGLAIEPGEIVAITGPNGSGKSTVLKMAAGLYPAQAGAVLIDGIDIRQLDAAELRSAIAYVPQRCQLIHGTIAQNLRLAEPTASEEDLARAAYDAGLMEDILGMPEGFETRLTDRLQRQLSNGFRQRLMLARAYIKNASIYLLDEPANNLDGDGDAALMRKLQQLRGRATVLIVTHRPSHMRLADRVVYVAGGQVLVAGTPDEILPKLGMA